MSFKKEDFKVTFRGREVGFCTNLNIKNLDGPYARIPELHVEFEISVEAAIKIIQEEWQLDNAPTPDLMLHSYRREDEE
jgi:hypothetical protein